MGYGTVNIGYQPKPEKTVLTLTHSKSGTIHTLVGLPEGFGLFTAQFKATADFVEGDTFAGGYTAKPTGEETALPDKAFISGDLVTVSVDKTRKMFYFSVGISGDFLPLAGGTMTGPAVGAPGAIAVPQFRNVQYGTEALTPGESPLPQGTLYITPEDGGAEPWSKVEFSNDYYELWESGKMRVLIPKRNYEKDVNPINSLIPNLEFFHSDDVLFNIPMGHYPSLLNPTSVAIAPTMRVWGEGFSYEAGTISLSTSEVRIRMYGMIIRPDENPSYKTMAYLPTIIYKSAF